jgi:serine/threonine-protein kinase RsbT
VTTAAGEQDELPIAADDDVVRVRQLVRNLAVRAKLSLVDQTKLVTAASELARNTLNYGGGGTARVQLVANGRRRGIQAVFADQGPGIPDIELALTDGWTSGNGMGLGLSGARRLVDEFELESEMGRGTTVSIVKWAR